MDDTGDAPAAEVAYENTAAEVWALKAHNLYERRKLQVAAFNTEGVASAQVWGPCPRCDHELNFQQTLSIPIAGVRGGRGLWSVLTGRDVPVAAGIPSSVDVGCGCGRIHPGAPEQITGCGVSFRLPTCPPDPTRTP